MGQEAIGLQVAIGTSYGKDGRHGVEIAYTRKSLIHIAVQINNVEIRYTRLRGRV